MTSVGDEYRELIAQHLSPQTPQIPFYSSVSSKVLREAADFGPRYWQDNLESPVLFHSAARALLADSKQCGVHLEVGPHAALSGPLRQIYKEASASINYVSTLVRNIDDTVAFLQAVGQLHSSGVRISYPVGSETVVTDLPKYPWHHEKSYWSESRIQKEWKFRKHLPHDLLGLRVLESSDVAPVWRNMLRTADIPWLNDHRVGDDTVFPAAGYVAIAGEAVFQISGVRDYTLRDVEINRALVLYNDKAVEMVTNLQPAQFSSAADNDWYTFQIVSHDGITWTTHCSGLVRSGRISSHPATRNRSFDRKVSTSRWYTTLSRAGLNYTGRFAGMNNIVASVVEPIAELDIVDEQDVEESSYMIHPSTLDVVFQSMSVAMTKGIYRHFDKMFLPTAIEELYIGDSCRKAIRVNTAAIDKWDTVRGESYGISNGEFVFSLQGFRGKPMANSGVEASEISRTLQIQFKPHYEFLNVGNLMQAETYLKKVLQMCERLIVLCAIETRSMVAGLIPAEPHLEKFRKWLDIQYERYQKPGYPLVEDSMDLVRLEPAERRRLIEEGRKECEDAGGWAFAQAIYRTYANAAEVFEGKLNHLELLLQDDVLIGVYSFYNGIWDVKDLTQLMGHAKPQLRILEIGAGTGGLTAKFLDHLRSDYGERLYLKYTFTDVSSGFFVQAKERFKDFEGIEYQALDISKSPLEQGFNAGEFDLIIASNVCYNIPMLPPMTPLMDVTGTTCHSKAPRDTKKCSNSAEA